MSSDSKKFDISSSTSPLSQTTTLIYSGPCRLNGVYINTVLSSHTVDVVDFDESTSPNFSKVLVTIPADAAAGSFYEFPGVSARRSLRVVSNAAATGDVTVMFTPGIPGNR